MKYGNIDKKALKTVIANYFNSGDYTLKNAIDSYGEDIIKAQYLLKDGRFEFFRAWSKTYSFMLIDDFMACGEKLLLGLHRNPPEELVKEKRHGTKRKNL